MISPICKSFCLQFIRLEQICPHSIRIQSESDHTEQCNLIIVWLVQCITCHVCGLYLRQVHKILIYLSYYLQFYWVTWLNLTFHDLSVAICSTCGACPCSPITFNTVFLLSGFAGIYSKWKHCMWFRLCSDIAEGYQWFL